MVASTAISTGVVTVVAIPIWLSAAMAPIPTITAPARFASSRPYDSPLSAPEIRVRTAAAIAEATTTITIATTALGSQATTPWIRSDTGFGPQTPKANSSVNSRTA